MKFHEEKIYILWKKFTWFFFTLPFFNKNFFHLVLNRTYFFSYENTIQKVKLFYDTSEKKIHSALLLLSSTQMYLIFLRIFSTLFSPWKTKIHLVPHTDFLFLVVFLRRIFFFTFLWETQRKWEKKYSHWFFFLLSSTYFFFCYWFSQRKYNVPLCDTHRTVLSGKKEFSEKNKKNKHIFLVRNNFFLSGPHTEQKK